MKSRATSSGMVGPLLLMTLMIIGVVGFAVLRGYARIDFAQFLPDHPVFSSRGNRKVYRATSWPKETFPKIEQAVYASRTGGYLLTVDPHDADRRFGATYRFTKDGTPLWSTDWSFALWDAVVTNAGMVAGYAYRGGLNGLTASDDGRGDLVVTMIDRHGMIRLCEKITRSGNVPHAPPLPTVSGFVLDEPNDRVLLRVKDRYFDKKLAFGQLRESWRCYRPSTTEFVERIDPFEKLKVSVPDMFLRVTDARLVAGTPLILVHWVHEYQGMGAIFTLIDPRGDHVWTLELPQDYEGLEGEQGERFRRGLFQGKGAILQTDQPDRFRSFFLQGIAKGDLCRRGIVTRTMEGG